MDSNSSSVVSEDNGANAVMAAYLGSRPEGQSSPILVPSLENSSNVKDSDSSSNAMSEDDGADVAMAAYINSQPQRPLSSLALKNTPINSSDSHSSSNSISDDDNSDTALAAYIRSQPAQLPADLPGPSKPSRIP